MKSVIGTEIKITSQQIQEELDSLRQQDSSGTPDSDLSFQNAAAVLMYFEPELLNAFEERPAQKDSAGHQGWTDYFSYCEPVKNKTKGNWWQLKAPLRIGILKRLETREKMSQALAANPDRTRDLPQQLFERAIREEKPDIEPLKREELVILLGILKWLKDVLPVAPLIISIQQAIPRADLLAPMRRLATDNFVGRKPELETLNKYVGIGSPDGVFTAAAQFIRGIFVSNLSDYPPVLIYGTGGVGKSTLLAKFILNNAKDTNKEGLPFAYLDIDRTVINPEEPETFIIEAAHQLAAQCPKLRVDFFVLRDDIRFSASTHDKMEVSKSLANWEDSATKFAAIVKSIDTPVLLAIDTFEEAQYLGSEVIRQIWLFLVHLQKLAPNLRTAVAGRAVVKEFPVQKLELTELSKEEARKMLSGELEGLGLSLKQLNKMIEDIIDIAGLNPLSLCLAKTVVINDGIKVLKRIETRNWLAVRIKSELIQARLYGRILAHIHDDEVKKLAYPGLIVRRITAEVIRDILAGPCGLTLNNLSEATGLLEEFSREISLVDPDPADGALVHRQDVRKIMLKDLKNKVTPEVILKIHDNAIAFYSGKDDNVSRAEEIYHLLCRGGDGLERAKSRWRPGLESRLRNALEELPTAERLWLSEKSGVTPDEILLKTADLESWEQVTARTAQRYLQTGNAADALKVIRTREERSEASPLYRLELEALRYQGMYDEASYRADEILANIPATAPPILVRELLLQMSFILEARGEIKESLEYVRKIEEILGDQPEPIEQIRVLTTHIRLLRKSGETNDETRRRLMDNVRNMLLDAAGIYSSLRNSPALLRELAAELGKMVPQLLREAIEWLGLELRNQEQIYKISEALFEWDFSLQPDAPGELAVRAGIKINNIKSWMNLIQQYGDRRLSDLVQNLRSELGTKQESAVSNFDKTLVDIYRISVDNAINRNLNQSGQ